MYNDELCKELLRISKIFHSKVLGLGADLRFNNTTLPNIRYTEYETDGYWMSFYKDSSGKVKLSLNNNKFTVDCITSNINAMISKSDSAYESTIAEHVDLIRINSTKILEYDGLIINKSLTKEEYFNQSLIKNYTLPYEIIKLAYDLKESLKNQNKLYYINYKNIDLDKLKLTVLK